MSNDNAVRTCCKYQMAVFTFWKITRHNSKDWWIIEFTFVSTLVERIQNHLEYRDDEQYILILRVL